MSSTWDDDEVSGAIGAMLEDDYMEEMADAYCDEEASPKKPNTSQGTTSGTGRNTQQASVDIPQDEMDDVFGNIDIDFDPSQAPSVLVRISLCYFFFLNSHTF